MRDFFSATGLFEKHKIKALAKHGFSYALVGLLATGVDFSCLYFLTERLHFFYLHSLVLAYFVAALVNYLLQKKITFKCKNNRYFSQFARFFVIGLFGLLINLTIVYVGTEYFDVWYFYGKIAATILAFTWNFSANRFFTFNLNEA